MVAYLDNHGPEKFATIFLGKLCCCKSVQNVIFNLIFYTGNKIKKLKHLIIFLSFEDIAKSSTVLNVKIKKQGNLGIQFSLESENIIFLRVEALAPV